MKASEVNRWLENNNAEMYAVKHRGVHFVIIYGPLDKAAGESCESLEEAIRMAQHSYDAAVILRLRRSARIVGQA